MLKVELKIDFKKQPNIDCLNLSITSGQRVPEPDPLPGISFDIRPESFLEIIG